MADVPPGYSSLHTRFLQLMMNHRMISSEDACLLFYNVYSSSTDIIEERNPTVKDMENAIALINIVIQRFNMEIREALDEVTCRKYYLLINTVDSAITRTFSLFTVNEMEYFKKILIEIITSDYGYVSSTMCLNLDSSLFENMKSVAEAVISKFCRHHLLSQKAGKLSLSLLSIVELEPFLTTVCKEIINICRLCKHVVIQGYKCRQCFLLYHLHCLYRYTRAVTSRPYTCPGCAAEQPEMTEMLNRVHMTSLSVDDNSDDEGPSTSGFQNPSFSESIKGKGVGKRSRKS